MDPLTEAHHGALEARKKMLDARPKDAIPPLPDTVVPDHTNCGQYFNEARALYARAADAYAADDVLSGHTFELWAFQYMALGQACQAQFISTRE